MNLVIPCTDYTPGPGELLRVRCVPLCKFVKLEVSDMMNSLRLVTRQNVHQLRKFHKCVTYRQTEAAAAVQKMTIPVPQGADKPVSPKIDKLANDISSLNLIEVSELSDLLKKRLNLPDAPVMPMGGFAAMKSPDADEDVAPQIVKTSFTVKLVKFDDKQKVALIKEIKNLIPGTNLVQAKKFVESIPVVVKSDIPKEESEQLKEAITKVGGEVEIS